MFTRMGLFRQRAIRIPPVVVLVLALALTAAATYFAYSFRASELDHKIDEITMRASAAIEDRLRSYANALFSVRDFLEVEAGDATRQEFSAFVAGMSLPQLYPGLIAVGYAKNSTSRSTPVVFLAPVAGEMIGQDMASDPARLPVLNLARDTGRPTLSSRLPLLTEDQQERSPGFLMIVPVFKRSEPTDSIEQRRAAITGFVYGAFHGRDLLSTLEEARRESRSGINLAVYDGDERKPESLLYDSGNAMSGPSLERVIRKEVDGRVWTVVVTAPISAFGGRRAATYLWVSILGLLASLIIFLYARLASDYAASLEKSESMLSLVTDSIPALVGYVDREHRYQYNNYAYEKWWGTPPEQLKGKTVSEILGPSYDRFFKPLLERALRGEHVTFEHSHEAPKTGRGRRYYRGEYIPHKAPDGQTQGIVVLVNDQTEQKAFQDKLRDEQRISELVNDVGMSLQGELNFDSLAQKITDVATELSGAEAGAFVFGDRLNAASGPLKKDIRVAGKEAHAIFQSDTIVRLDDVSGLPEFRDLCTFEIRSYLAAPVISRSGDTLGGLLFVHTRAGMFTERAEKLIGGIAAQAAVALDNARLYSEAQAVNRVKDEFLATLSHELRTPMNVILGYSELLKDEEQPANVRTYAETIHRNAKAQNQLIADLLDISAIITGKLAFTPVKLDANEVVHNAIDNIRFAAEAKGVVLVRDISPRACPVLGDATRVQQIVWNLLSNAIKFTPAGGKVTIHVRSAGGRGADDGNGGDGASAGFCEITVIDTGIGIDADFLPYIFDRFSQEDSGRSRRYGGLGLGLSIVRQLVELHGGQIFAESEGKNKGARFTVRLPLDRFQALFTN